MSIRIIGCRVATVTYGNNSYRNNGKGSTCEGKNDSGGFSNHNFFNMKNFIFSIFLLSPVIIFAQYNELKLNDKLTVKIDGDFPICRDCILNVVSKEDTSVILKDYEIKSAAVTFLNKDNKHFSGLAFTGNKFGKEYSEIWLEDGDEVCKLIIENIYAVNIKTGNRYILKDVEIKMR